LNLLISAFALSLDPVKQLVLAEFMSFGVCSFICRIFRLVNSSQKMMMIIIIIYQNKYLKIHEFYLFKRPGTEFSIYALGYRVLLFA